MSESIPELPAKHDDMAKEADALLQMILSAKREMEDGYGLRWKKSKDF